MKNMHICINIRRLFMTFSWFIINVCNIRVRVTQNLSLVVLPMLLVNKLLQKDPGIAYRYIMADFIFLFISKHLFLSLSTSYFSNLNKRRKKVACQRNVFLLNEEKSGYTRLMKRPCILSTFTALLLNKQGCYLEISVVSFLSATSALGRRNGNPPEMRLEPINHSAGCFVTVLCERLFTKVCCSLHYAGRLENSCRFLYQKLRKCFFEMIYSHSIVFSQVLRCCCILKYSSRLQ